jgi:DNA glycosylase AlkZ-like
MPVPNLEVASAVSDGLARHHLCDDARATDVVQTSRDLVGLHATGAPNPYLQLRVRLSGFERSMLDSELYEQRSLVRVRCMRGTLFALPLDLLPIAWAATRHLVLNMSTSYLASHGLDLKSYEQWAKRIEALLSTQALSALQVRSALGAGRQVRLPAVLNQMCDEGRLLRDRPFAGWRDARHTYRGFAEALPDVRLDSCRPVEATVLLVERYVARYGPVTLDDVAWWTGLGVGRCRTACDELGDRRAHVRVRGWAGEHFVLRADLDRLLHAPRSRGPQLSLLAELDPYTMGFRGRARLLDDTRHNFVYDRSGNATNVALVDGRIAGVWDVNTERHEARFHPFGTLAIAVEERVRAELAEMGAFISGSAVSVQRVDRMTPPTERRAGWVRKPLHNGREPEGGG